MMGYIFCQKKKQEEEEETLLSPALGQAAGSQRGVSEVKARPPVMPSEGLGTTSKAVLWENEC